MKINRY